MIERLELGTCLKGMLEILGISGNKLAKALNVDASLVNRWINGKRRVPKQSDYILRISYYLSKNIVSKVQEKEIRNMANIYFNTDKYSDTREVIYDALFISNSNISNRNKKQYDMSFKNEELLNISHIDNDFSIIYDAENILKAAVELLKKAESIKECRDNSIYMTKFTSYFLTNNSKNYKREWYKKLIRLLKNGWSARTLVYLDKNINVHFMYNIYIPLLFVDYSAYYFNKHDILTDSLEYLIIPDVGTLICFIDTEKEEAKCAFLFRNKDATNIIKNRLEEMLDESRQLIKYYSSSEDTGFDELVMELEGKSGNTYVYKGGINSITIPRDIYIKYLLTAGISKDCLDKKLNSHLLRLENFKRHIKYYKYYDIYSKSGIENMLQKGEFIFDGININGNTPLNRKDIKLHIENTIRMLRKYDNYNIALIDYVKPRIISKATYYIKQHNSVIIRSYDMARINKKKSNIIISEATIVNSFENYFYNVWEDISPVNKDKENIIMWLENQIKKLK